MIRHSDGCERRWAETVGGPLPIECGAAWHFSCDLGCVNESGAVAPHLIAEGAAVSPVPDGSVA